MTTNKLTIGFCMCGSFCTLRQAVNELIKLQNSGYTVIPIMSEITYSTDTKFGNAKDFIDEIEEATQRKIIHTIKDAEPLGPSKLIDVLVIAPCTGNTIAKIANGITDTSVTMAAKGHLRNLRPVVICVSTNDAIGISFKNIATLNQTKNIYILPFKQDNVTNKPNSAMSDLSLLVSAIEAAYNGKQLRPLFM